MTDPNDKPPFFRRWSHWYMLVIGFLAVLIILFYLVTKKFA